MTLKAKLFLILMFLFGHLAQGQKKVVDSLQKRLENYPHKDTIRVDILNDLAYACYNNNDSKKVKIYTVEAASLARQLNYPNGEAFAYRRLSTVYMDDNANPLALEYLDKAYKIFKHLNDTLNCARTLTNLGVYYHAIKDYKLSLIYFSSALEQAKKIERHKMVILLLCNTGDIYEKNGLINKAYTNYSEALALTIKTNDAGYLSLCYANLASIHLKKKDYKTALNYCNKVITMLTNDSSSTDLSDASAACVVKAKVYYIQKRFDLSRQLLNRAIVLSEITHNSTDRLVIYHDFFLLDSAQHNYEAAFKSSYRFHKLNDSLVNINKNQIAALYNVRFDSQLRDDENKRLRISEERNRAIISKQHTVEAALFIGLAFICLGFIYFQRINAQVKAKNKIIAEQNLVLENSNMVKDKLFSVISHDLRSPVTQLISIFNMWENSNLNKEELSTITPVIKADIINTLELLDNLLIWSKKQLQGFHFSPEPFDVYQLANETIADLKNNILQKKLTVENNITPGTKVHADSAMIKIVLRNLMTNAIKFTPQMGTISVSCYPEKDKLIICVKDTGVGIKKADLHKIFSLITHTTAGTDNEKGTGIGLRICQEFTEMNKGKIWVESEPNAGSTFCFSLPLG